MNKCPNFSTNENSAKHSERQCCNKRTSQEKQLSAILKEKLIPNVSRSNSIRNNHTARGITPKNAPPQKRVFDIKISESRASSNLSQIKYANNFKMNTNHEDSEIAKDKCTTSVLGGYTIDTKNKITVNGSMAKTNLNRITNIPLLVKSNIRNEIGRLDSLKRRLSLQYFNRSSTNVITKSTKINLEKDNLVIQKSNILKKEKIMLEENKENNFAMNKNKIVKGEILSPIQIANNFIDSHNANIKHDRTETKLDYLDSGEGNYCFCKNSHSFEEVLEKNRNTKLLFEKLIKAQQDLVENENKKLLILEKLFESNNGK